VIARTLRPRVRCFLFPLVLCIEAVCLFAVYLFYSLEARPGLPVTHLCTHRKLELPGMLLETQAQ
jgi:hypothetical protein